MMVGYHDIMKKISVVHRNSQINRIGTPVCVFKKKIAGTVRQSNGASDNYGL